MISTTPEKVGLTVVREFAFSLCGKDLGSAAHRGGLCTAPHVHELPPEAPWSPVRAGCPEGISGHGEREVGSGDITSKGGEIVMAMMKDGE